MICIKMAIQRTKSLFFSSGRVLLVLIAPAMLAALSAVPHSSSVNEPTRSAKCMNSIQSFCMIERLVHRSPQWTVIGRSYHPDNPNWALVLWCDSSRRSGQIDQDELLVLEHQSVSRSIVATMRLRSAPPSAPLDHGADTGSGFIRALRGNLSFRSVVVGRTNELNIIALVNQTLSRKVREVEQPNVSLTSPLF